MAIHVGWTPRAWTAVLVVACALSSPACRLLDDSPPPRPQPNVGQSRASASPVFTTAHSTVRDAVNDFFGVRPEAQQPIPFPHNTHIAKGLTCTEYCHESVTKGPIAGLPSVKTCMICHDAIAADRPIIQQMADSLKRGEDIAWQRVYGYAREAHVRFNHAPHIRAGVECSTCHGNVAEQTVAQRVVDLNMGFCVTCHKAKQASNDCLTCHF